MYQINIDRSHMLEKRKTPGQRPRTVIVKFPRRDDRQSVFRNKNLLKGIGISVTESFIQKRMENLKKMVLRMSGYQIGQFLKKMTVIQKFIVLVFTQLITPGEKNHSSVYFLLLLGFHYWGISWLLFKYFFLIFGHNPSLWRGNFNFYNIKNCLTSFYQ